MANPAVPQIPETLRVLEEWIALKAERARDRAGPRSRSRVGNVVEFIGLPRERQLTYQQEGQSNNRWGISSMKQIQR